MNFMVTNRSDDVGCDESVDTRDVSLSGLEAMD
jgi:hypothetical protein